MIIWRASNLAEALRDGRVTESQKARYLIGVILLQFVLGRVGLLGLHQTYQSVLVLFLITAVTVFGVPAAFRINQRGDGRQFIERYVCLAFPLTIRFYAFYALSAVVLYLLTGRSGTLGGDLWVSALYLVWLAWFYIALRTLQSLPPSRSERGRPPNMRLKLTGARQQGTIALPRPPTSASAAPPCARGRCARSLSAIR